MRIVSGAGVRWFAVVGMVAAGILTLIGSGGGGGPATPDTTPPTVVETSPRDTAAGIYIENDVSATFSEAINGSTINSSTFIVTESGGAAVPGAFVISGSVVTFNPTSPLNSGTAYNAQITTGLTDLAGNPLGATYSWSFTTERNVWQATDTTDVDTPTARAGHTAVWTGSEMVVWGGGTGSTNYSTGGRYDPAAAAGSAWQTTSTTNAPAARIAHTAVWTGGEMIVWGGSTGDNTGGRYDPAAAAGSAWQTTSTTNAPAARTGHTAVWTGTHMIVWGGTTTVPERTNTGALYNPTTDAWQPTAITGAPLGRTGHTAVWTGTHMIVWGGTTDLGAAIDGALYNPTTNTWQATSITGAPLARTGHTAVWTGTHMIVWGGTTPGVTNTGASYNPATNTWEAISTSNAPTARTGHTAVWSGDHMIVWGGSLNTGGRYDPAIGAWKATTTTNAPSARTGNTAIWSGSEMIVWGGNTGSPTNDGGRYAP